MAAPARWPTSFLQLALAGYLAVSLPLLAALLDAGRFSIRLSRDTAAVVEQAAVTAADARLLLNHVLGLERRARQLDVLWDPQLLEDYRERAVSVRDTAARLASAWRDPGQRRRLRELLQAEQQISGQLLQGPREAGAAERALAEFESLSRLAREILEEGIHIGVRNAEAIGDQAASMRARVIWEAVGVIALALITSVVFTALLNRPIRRIGVALQRMGSGDLTVPVAVGGPRDLAALGEQLDWLRTRLQEAAAEKTRFMARVSHELKTPLAAIRTGSELLDEEVVGGLTAQQREVVAILRRSTFQLQRLVDNLLQFSMDAARSVEVRSDRFNPATLAEGVIAECKPLILAKNLTVLPHLPAGEVRLDRDRVRLILGNLLSNAIKFSPNGGEIEVRLSLAAAALQVEICDQGPGVPEADRKRILDPFYQGEARHLGAVRGSGLGLTIVKECTEVLGGTMAIGASPAGGARFRVSLPIVAEDPMEDDTR